MFYYFLDTVVKPRYDTERIFRSTQQDLLAMTTFSIHAGITIVPDNFYSMSFPRRRESKKKYKYSKFLKLKARFMLDSCFRRNDIGIHATMFS
ncbi:MAG: hypothetical protein LN560_01970 [Rickettsia endosymbiont of Sceptobius lativentris]|nr:hypothetical protein [Rickettsia endosymbiont of Sceptobius lativentris]